MESKLQVLWDLITDHLVKRTLTEQLVTEKLEPFFNYNLFKQRDIIHNSLFSYAIVYKSNILVKFILKKINFEDLEEELQNRLTEEVMHLIVDLSIDVEKNGDFLTDLLKMIGESSFKNLLFKHTTQKEVSYFLKHLNLLNKKSFKVLGEYLRVLEKDCKLDSETSVYFKSLKESYTVKYRNLIWEHLDLTKFSSKKEFYQNNDFFQQNILHHAVLKEKFDELLSCGALKEESLLIDRGVLELILKTSPFKFLKAALSDNVLKRITAEIGNEDLSCKPGQNLLHMALTNRSLKPEELLDVLTILSKYDIKPLLNQPDLLSMIPLTFFLQRNSSPFKLSSKFSPKVLSQIASLLLPQTPQQLTDDPGFLIIYTEMELHRMLYFKPEPWYDSNQLFLHSALFASFNTNIIRAAVNFGNENLLLEIWDKMPALNLNCHCVELPNHAMGRFHVLKLLLEAGFHRTIERFFDGLGAKDVLVKIDFNKEIFEQNLKDARKQVSFKNMFSIRKTLLDLPQQAYYFSVFDSALDSLHQLDKALLASNEQVKRAKTVLLEKLRELLGRTNNQDLNAIFLNISFSSVVVRSDLAEMQDPVTIFFSKIFRDDDPELIEIFEPRLDCLDLMSLQALQAVLIVQNLAWFNSLAFIQNCPLNHSIRSIYTNYWISNKDEMEWDWTILNRSLYQACQNKGDYLSFLLDSPGAIEAEMIECKLLKIISLFAGKAKDQEFISKYVNICISTLQQALAAIEKSSESELRTAINLTLESLNEIMKKRADIREGLVRKLVEESIIVLILEKLDLENTKNFLKSVVDGVCDCPELLDQFKAEWTAYENSEQRDYKSEEFIFTINTTNLKPESIDSFLKAGFRIRTKKFRLLKKESLSQFKESSQYFNLMMKARGADSSSSFFEEALKSDENAEFVKMMMEGLGSWQVFRHSRRVELYEVAIEHSCLKNAEILLRNASYLSHLSNKQDSIPRFLQVFFERIFFEDQTHTKGIPLALMGLDWRPAQATEPKKILQKRMSKDITRSKIWKAANELPREVIELIMEAFPSHFEGENASSLLENLQLKTRLLMFKYLPLDQLVKLSRLFDCSNVIDAQSFLGIAISSGENDKIMYAANGAFSKLEEILDDNLGHVLMALCQEQLIDVSWQILSEHKEKIKDLKTFPRMISKLLEISVKADRKDVCLRLLQLIRANAINIDFAFILSKLTVLPKGECYYFLILRVNEPINIYQLGEVISEKRLSFPVHINDANFEKTVSVNHPELLEIYKKDRSLFAKMKILECLYLNGFFNKLNVYYRALFSTSNPDTTEEFKHFHSKINILMENLVEAEFGARETFLSTKGKRVQRKNKEEQEQPKKEKRSKVFHDFWNNYLLELDEFPLTERMNHISTFFMEGAPGKSETKKASESIKTSQKAKEQLKASKAPNLEEEQEKLRNFARKTNNRVKSVSELEKKISLNQRKEKTEQLYEKNRARSFSSKPLFQEIHGKLQPEFGEQSYRATLDKSGEILLENIESLLSSDALSQGMKNEVIKDSLCLIILAVPFSYRKFVGYFSKIKNLLRENRTWAPNLHNISLMVLLSFVKVLDLLLKNLPVRNFNNLQTPPDPIKNCIDFIKTHLDEVRLESIDDLTKSLVHNILADLYLLSILSISVEFWSYLRSKLKVQLAAFDLRNEILYGFLNQAIALDCRKTFIIYVHMIKSVPQLFKLNIKCEDEESEKTENSWPPKDWRIVKLKKVKWEHSIAMETVMNLLKFKQSEFLKKLLGVGFILNQAVGEECIKMSAKYDGYLTSYSRGDKGALNIFEYVILIKRKQLVSLMIETFRVEEHYLLAAVESGSFDVFVMLAESLFEGSKQSIFEFIIKNHIIMNLASVGNEEFLLKLFEKYVSGLFQPYREKKGLLEEENLLVKGRLEDLMGRNCNIFHFIAQWRMRRLLYSVLEYFSKFRFKLDKSKIKGFLETFLHMKISKGSIENGRTPLNFALSRQFYELLDLGIEYNLELKYPLYTDIELNESDQIILKALNEPGYYSRFLFATSVQIESTAFNKKYVSRLRLFEIMRAQIMRKLSLATKPSSISSSMETHQMIEMIIFGSFLKKVIKPETIFEILIKLLKEPLIELIYLVMEFFLDLIFRICVDKRSLRRFICLPNEEYLFYAFEKFEVHKTFYCEQTPLEFYSEFSRNDKTGQDRSMLELKNNEEVKALISELLTQEEKTAHLRAKSWGSESATGLYFDPNELFEILLYAQERKFTKVSFFILKMWPETFLMKLQESGSKLADLDRGSSGEASIVHALIHNHSRPQNVLKKALINAAKGKNKYRVTKSTSLVKSPSSTSRNRPPLSSSTSLSSELLVLTNQSGSSSFLLEYGVNDMLLSFYFLRVAENARNPNLNSNFERELKLYAESFLTAIPFQRISTFKVLFSILAGRKAKEDVDNLNMLNLVSQGLGANTQFEALERILHTMLETLSSLPMMVNLLDSFCKDILQSLHLEKLMSSSESDVRAAETLQGPKLNVTFYITLIDHILNVMTKWRKSKFPPSSIEIQQDGLKKILNAAIEKSLENASIRRNYIFLAVALGASLSARLLSAFGIIDELLAKHKSKLFLFKFEAVDDDSSTGLFLESSSKDLKDFVLKLRVKVKQEPNLIFNIELNYDTALSCFEKIENLLFLETYGQEIDSALSTIKTNTMTNEIERYNLVFDIHSLESLPLKSKHLVLEELLNPEQGKLSYFMNELKLLIRQQNLGTLFTNDDMFAPHNTFQLSSMAALGAGDQARMNAKGINFSYILEQQPDSTYEVRLQMRTQGSKRPSSSRIRKAPGKVGEGEGEGMTAFSEFYVLQNFPSNDFKIKYVPYQESLSLNDAFGVYGNLQEYDELTALMLKGGEATESLKDWSPQLGFTITPGDKLICLKDDCLLYTVSRMRGLLNEFEEKLNYLGRGGLGRRTKINIISFYEVFMENFMKIFRSTAGSHPLLDSHSLDSPFTILQSFLENSILKKVLELIIHETLQNCEQLLTITRGIYIEFLEIDESYLDQAERINESFLSDFDQLFRFSRTKYILHKNMLIIRFCVCFVKTSLNEKPRFSANLPLNELDDRESSLAEYLILVTNKFDFLEQILSPEQMIAFALDKNALERIMLETSKKMSEKMSKMMTLSINFESLNSIFKNILIQIKNEGSRLAKLREYERVWSCLFSIKKYFTVTHEEKILKQFTKTSFDEYFYSQYLNLYLAFREAKALSTKSKENHRIYEVFNPENKSNLEADKDFLDLPKQFFNIVKLNKLRIDNDDGMSSFLTYSFYIKMDINSFCKEKKIGSTHQVKTLLVNQSRIGDVFIIGQPKDTIKAIQVASKSKLVLLLSLKCHD